MHLFIFKYTSLGYNLQSETNLLKRNKKCIYTFERKSTNWVKTSKLHDKKIIINYPSFGNTRTAPSTCPWTRNQAKKGQKENPCRAKRSLQQRVFPSGLPPQYWPVSTLLNFGDQTRPGVFNVIWPQTRV